MSGARAVAAWHEYVEKQDPQLLDDLLSDEVVFHSPVVHTPQRGKPVTSMYLRAALAVLGPADFQYQREIIDGNNAVLEFTAEIDGILINGVDMIEADDEGHIVDFKVMVRPLQAINMLHQKMGEMLQKVQAR